VLHETPRLSRRKFLGTAAALAASSAMPSLALAAADARPDSKFDGVQIGTNTYSYRSLPRSAENVLKYIVRSGINSVELAGATAEQFVKAYVSQDDTQKSDSIDGFKALRKLYNDAGVEIHIVKFPSIGDSGMSDGQIEYYFQAANALGAKGITRELSKAAAKRLGPIADKHQIIIGFHNHTQIKPTTYDDDILSYGKFLRINLDVGHYVAGTSQSPLPLIEKHHERIISLHLKDRKKNNGPNMPFGQGDTPLAEILRYMKKTKATFFGDIELEYDVPKDSDAVKEVAKCVQFCKDVLS